jgi:hypothetical protein
MDAAPFPVAYNGLPLGEPNPVRDNFLIQHSTVLYSTETSSTVQYALYSIFVMVWQLANELTGGLRTPQNGLRDFAAAEAAKAAGRL